MVNVLDLSPANFRNYLAESQGMHGYTPDRINQLRAAYRHHNSLSGALDRAGEQGLDGMNTSTFLPLAGPQGMSIWDALKSGQAQTRFKDWATDALGAVVRGVENPRSAAQGLLSPEEMPSAGMESAGFAMLGAGSIPARLRVPDPGGQTVGTNFGGVGHNQGPPLEPDELIPPARPNDIPTYSPSVRAAEQLPQEKGTYEQFRKMLLDRGAKEDELEWSGFDAYFRDQERVTKAGVLSYLMDNAGDKMIDVQSNTAEGMLDEDGFLDPDDMIERYVETSLDEEIRYYLNDVRHEWLNDGDHMLARDMDEADLRIAAAENDITDLDEFKQLLVDEYDGADTWMSPSTWGGGARPRDYTIHADEDAALDFVLNEDTAREMASENLYETARSMDVVDLADNLGLGGMANVADSGVKFADYFTPGARDYTENRFIYSPVDDASRGPTFGAAHHDESDIMVHTRTAQFPLSLRSGNVHHVGEVQSDWGQQLRREADTFGEHGKIYRSRTFDEQKGIAEGIAASSELSYLREHARNVYRREQSFDDVDDPSTGLDADIYKHHYGVPITTRDPDAQPFNPEDQQILDYFLDPTVKTDAAVKMKEQYGDYYKKLSRARSTGLDIHNQKAKTGGPLIASTNKWVDFALRRELNSAVQSGNEWMTISNPDMVQKMTMGQTHGQGEFYGKIVPQRLQKIIRSFDKNAKLQKTSILTADGEKEVLGIRLTDDLVRKMADKGMPIFSNASKGAGLLAAGTAKVDTSYRGSHQPKGPEDEYPVRLDDVTKTVSGEEAGYPNDFYSINGSRYYAPGPRFEGDEFGLANQESYRAILAARSNPDAEVTIYRAVPNDDEITSINSGDFVTLSPKYAELHSLDGYGRSGEDAGKVLSQKVRVKDIFFDGNDVNEFGYFPDMTSANASAPAASVGLLSATDTQQQQQPMRGLLQ